MEQGVEIDRHRPAPAFVSQLREWRAFRRAGIVDEDRDRALRLAGGGEALLDLGAVGDVGRRDQGVERLGADLFQLLPPPADQGQLRAFGGQRARDRGADAGAAAGDQGVLALEPHAFSSASRCRLRASWAMPPRYGGGTWTPR